MNLDSSLLLISPWPEDEHRLRPILGQFGTFRVAATYREAEDRLQEEPASVILSESSLPDGCWKDVLGRISGLDKPPVLVVTSAQADERLWAEVLNLGGYDVLTKPFDDEEVARVMLLARLQWQQQQSQLRSGIPAAVGSHSATPLT